jgi:S-(hydroxymethyl)glutathione dehydrogenase / alcohol dehydrogenase
VQAFDMTPTEGTVTLVGMPGKDERLTLPTMPAVTSGKRLCGSAVGPSQILRDLHRFVRLTETGQLQLGSMVSRRIRP